MIWHAKIDDRTERAHGRAKRVQRQHIVAAERVCVDVQDGGG